MEGSDSPNRTAHRGGTASSRLLALLMCGASQADLGWPTKDGAPHKGAYARKHINRSIAKSDKTNLLGQCHPREAHVHDDQVTES